MRVWVLLLLLAAPAVAEPHGPIRIVSDLDFQDPRSGVSSGTGTIDDPYIIEDLRIVPGLLELGGDGAAIHIEGTEAHVVLRDITVDTIFPAAIRVHQARNVTFDGVALERQHQAVWLDQVRDVRLEAFDIRGTGGSDPFGVVVTDSHRVVLRAIQAVEGDGVGVQVTNSRFVRIEGASVRDHEGGYRIQGSHDVDLVGLIAAQNRGDGIWMRNLTRLDARGLVAHGQEATGGANTGRGIVAWNVVGGIHEVAAIGNDAVGMLVFEGNLPVSTGQFLENGGAGLHAEADRVELRDIEAHGNRQQGIAIFPDERGVASVQALRLHDNGAAGLYVEGMGRMVLRDIRSEANEGAGVVVRDGGNMTFLDGTLLQNREGLLLVDVHEGEVRDSRADGNRVGFQLHNAVSVRLESNTAEGNGGDGFDILGQDLWLNDNVAKGNLGFGIRVRDGANATLVGNTVADNALGDLSDGVVQHEAPMPWLLPALLLAVALQVLHQRP